MSATTTQAAEALPRFREHRCPRCDRYLGRSPAEATGWVEIYCPRCNRPNRFHLLLRRPREGGGDDDQSGGTRPAGGSDGG